MDCDIIESMEKLPHQEYRDDLADKLKEIRNSDPENPELAKAKAQGYLQGRKDDKGYGRYKTTYFGSKKAKINQPKIEKAKIKKAEIEKAEIEKTEILSKDLEEMKENELLGYIFKNAYIVSGSNGTSYYRRIKLEIPKDKHNLSLKMGYLLNTAKTLEVNSSLLPESFAGHFDFSITDTFTEMNLDSINYHLNKDDDSVNKQLANILNQYVEKITEVPELVLAAEENPYNIIRFGLDFGYVKQDDGWKTRFYIHNAVGGLPSVSNFYKIYDKDGKKIEFEEEDVDN